MATGKRINEMVTVDYSPEKAGVGGSTPSLATTISKHLFATLRFLLALNMPTERGYALNGEACCRLLSV
jgi:hypothetical protein